MHTIVCDLSENECSPPAFDLTAAAFPSPFQLTVHLSLRGEDGVRHCALSILGVVTVSVVILFANGTAELTVQLDFVVASPRETRMVLADPCALDLGLIRFVQSAQHHSH